MPTKCYELSAAGRATLSRCGRRMGEYACRIHPETTARQPNFQRSVEVMNTRDILCLYPLCSNAAWSPQLVFSVAKSGYRRVIRKAGVQRRRPFRVLSPVLARTSGANGSLKVLLSVRRARRPGRTVVAPQTRFRPKLSAVSLSRAVWVNGCCFRSIAPKPLGLLSDSLRCESRPFELRCADQQQSGRGHRLPAVRSGCRLGAIFVRLGDLFAKVPQFRKHREILRAEDFAVVHLVSFS